MSATPTDTELSMADDGGVEVVGGALLFRVRERVAEVVGTYPRASLVGAFALGFVLAKLVRKIGEGRS